MTVPEIVSLIIGFVLGFLFMQFFLLSRDITK